MNAHRFWFVSLVMTFICGCGRARVEQTATPTPPAQTDSAWVGSDISAEPSQRPAEAATNPFLPPPASALAEFRATMGRAFDALRKQGIVAEPKFEDCVRCAVAAMSDLLEERDAPGGVYWHDQDDVALEQGDDLMIGFVAREDGDAATIAQKLVAALKAEGLTVEWDGSVQERVLVKVPWNKPQAADGQVGKPAPRSATRAVRRGASFQLAVSPPTSWKLVPRPTRCRGASFQLADLPPAS